MGAGGVATVACRQAALAPRGASGTHRYPMRERQSGSLAAASRTMVRNSDASMVDVEDQHMPKTLTFMPPLAEQRYVKVYKILEKIIHAAGYEDPRLKTVLEVGCGELRFHRYVRHASFTVRKIIYLDKNEELLKNAEATLRPLTKQHMLRRETPLTVEAYAGCITRCDPRIFNVDPPIFSVIAMEVIQHLDPVELLGFENTIFGLIHPPLIVITTPNADFNPAFGLGLRQFRHPDHRFEWTKVELERWCLKVCETYPNYSFWIDGIGEAPSRDLTRPLVDASLSATFRHREECNRNLGDLPVHLQGLVVKDSYKLIARKEYEYFVQPSTVEQRILREVLYFLDTTDLSRPDLGFERQKGSEGPGGRSTVDIPVEKVFQAYGLPKGVHYLSDAIDVLKKAGYKLTLGGPRREFGLTVSIPREVSD